MIVDITNTSNSYDIIYADPPWQYNTYDLEKRKASGATTSGLAQHHYNVMTLADIKKLPISSISKKDSVLCMWTTYPCLPEALEVIDAWGFKYTTCLFTWVKTNRKSGGYFMGLGHYTRANAEICLFAKRGKGLKRVVSNVSQIVESPLTEHSKKPDEVADRIKTLFGEKNRIELFARREYPGFDCWGNEV